MLRIFPILYKYGAAFSNLARIFIEEAGMDFRAKNPIFIARKPNIPHA